MKILQTIGIDVSKKSIDVRIHTNRVYSQFENSRKGFKRMAAWVNKNNSFAKEETMIVFEHTGLYSYNLAVYLAENLIPFIMVPGLEVKRSLGLARGKDDKIDATKLARYGYRLRDELEPYKMPSKDLTELKRLLTLRDRLVKQRAGYITSFKEQKRVLKKDENRVLFQTQERMISYLSKQTESVEKEINSIINNNDEIKRLYDLILTIKSVGPQTALYMIVLTAGFTRFENARKFASFSGIAPFPNLSGISLKGKTKVSPLANKKIKSLLDLCAKNAILHNYEMKTYYESRVEKGKSKMSTINIIRNKLLARIFAVVKRQSPYVDLMKYAA
jgi:transposase